MGVVTAFPVILFLTALWAFLKFPPDYPGREAQVRTFNIMVLSLVPVLWGGWYLVVADYVETYRMVQYKYLLSLGLGGAFFFFYVVGFFFVRNFWVFGGRR